MNVEVITARWLYVWTDASDPGIVHFAGVIEPDEAVPFGPFADQAFELSYNPRLGGYRIVDVSPTWPEPGPEPGGLPSPFEHAFQNGRPLCRYLWVFDDDDLVGGFWRAVGLVERHGDYYEARDWHSANLPAHDSHQWSIGPGSTVPVFYGWPVERRQQVRYW